MNKTKVILGNFFLILAFTVILGSLSTSDNFFLANEINNHPSSVSFDIGSNIEPQSQKYERTASFSQDYLESLSNIQWSYATKTYYKNDINWVEINSSTVDILPFSHRYRVNYDLNDWEIAYGMTPGYVPIRLLTYMNNSIAPGEVWTNETGDFPTDLRFIPGFPVTINLDVVNASVDGEVSLFVYDSTNPLAIAQSTSVGPDSVTFTPTTEEIHFVRILNIDSINARIILQVKQNINPSLITVYIGDSGNQYDSFNWQFSSQINSFGLNTPDNLDLSNVSVLDDLSGAGEINFSYGLFDVHGKDFVYDNDTWLPQDLYFRVSGDAFGACNGGLPAIDQCNGFLRAFYSAEDIATLNTNGLWTSLNPVGNSFGSNSQILKFIAYYGEGASPSIIDSIDVTDDLDNVIYILDSSDYKSFSLSSFSDQFEVKINGKDLSTGNYKLRFLSTSVPVYEYPFAINDNLYGNFNDPVLSLGFEVVDNLKTLVFLKITESDTTIDQVAFSYTTDGSTWTDSRNMTLIDSDSYGFVINGLENTILNYSLSVFESVPDDTGNTRFKIRSVLGSDTVDLNSETNTTLDLKITAYGSSPASATIRFGLNSEYGLVPDSGTISEEGQNYRFDIGTILNDGQEYVYKFTMLPRNPSLTPLQIPINVTSGIFSDSGSISFMVSGPATPIVDLSISPLPILYSTLFDTYSIKIFYNFNGGSPKTNATLDISSTSGSFDDKFIQLDFQNIFPNTEYAFDVDLDVLNDFEGEDDDITVILSFDDSSQEISDIIQVNSLPFSELLEITLVDPPFIFKSSLAEEVTLNISVKSTINVAISDLTLTFITSGTSHTVQPSSVSTGAINALENKFYTVTMTIKANFVPDSSIYGFPLTITYGTITEQITLELDTDYTPPTGTTSTNTTSSSTPTSSAPPTSGFELVTISSTLLALYIVLNRKRK